MADIWDTRLGLVRLLDALNDPELDLEPEPELVEVETLLVAVSNRMRSPEPQPEYLIIARS